MKTKTQKHFEEILILFSTVETKSRLLLLGGNLDSVNRKKVIKLLKLTEKVKDEIAAVDSSNSKDLMKKSSDFTNWLNNLLRIIAFFN